MNHDTQPGQVMDSPIEFWFRPLAYALILLRIDGYPNIWYGDLHGIKGEEPHAPTCYGRLPDLLLVRKLYAYGKQYDYFDKPDLIGWTREGTWDRPHGLACIMSSGRRGGTSIMYVGKKHAGETWTDILEWCREPVRISKSGFGTFSCQSKSISIFTNSTALGRQEFGRL
jgi:alpha-amylase